MRNERAWPQRCWNALAITEQKKCWELLAEKFDRFQTLRNDTQKHLRNNMQQGVKTDATCNIQQCWEFLVNNVASVCTQPKSQLKLKTMLMQNFGGTTKSIMA